MLEPLKLTLLQESDATEVLAFERDNRLFFAAWVADRGDDYFTNFGTRHRALVGENQAGRSLLYVVRGAEHQMIGRVNITDIDDEDVTELGYRLSGQVRGQGLATRMVAQALAHASTLGVKRLRARTTTHNVASQRVLERLGFARTPGPDETLEVMGQLYPVLHYAVVLTADQ